MRKNYFQCLVAGLGLALLSACATNPVTGEQELALVSEATELDIGRSQYAPSRQMQGGDYNLDAELSRYVNQVGQRLAAVSDRRLPYEFTVVNDSSPNAWALPGGKVAVNRGLLTELNSEAELAAVLGHEIVHAAARHGAQGMERGLLLQGALIATGIALRDRDYSNLVVGGAALGANLVNQRYSREAEREADYYGMTYMVRAGYDPHAAVQLQETFVRLSEEQHQDWLSGLFASHPPSQERVQANRETLRRLGKSGGEWGEERYRRMIAALRSSKPAYDAYDDGRKLLREGKTEEALVLAQKAMRLEPREALFHGLQGEVLYRQERYHEALTSFEQALARDSGFFRHYLLRGLAREKTGDSRGARHDLERSIELLPTTTAYHALGRLSLAEGRRQQAMEYLRQAADSRSPEGQAAAETLARLDLPENPERYLKAGLALDRQGLLLVVVENPTRLTVRNVRIVLGKQGAGGRLTQVRTRWIAGPIRPGRGVQIATDIGPLGHPQQLREWGVRVADAEVVE